MGVFIKVLGIIVREIIVDALTALGLSGLFSLIRVIFGGSITWEQFFRGAFVLFVFFLLYYVYNIIRTRALMKKDPVYRDAAITLGMTWWNYKRMKKKS